MADRRAGALAGQFIFDDQVHFVRDDFSQTGLLDLAKYARQNWNPALAGDNNLARYKFENFVKEIYVDSDTKVALLSGAPFDDPTWDLLTNDQIAAARSGHQPYLRLAAPARSRGDHPQQRPLDGRGGSVHRPGPARQLEGLHRRRSALAVQARPFWRLDDEKLMYPFYEKAVKAGITTICIHKGLLPADYQKSWAQAWQYNTVWDVGKAAQGLAADELRHLSFRAPAVPGAAGCHARPSFRSTGRHRLGRPICAEIPAKFGVNNVYGEIGTSFATCAVSSPHLAAALVGTLVRGLGADHVPGAPTRSGTARPSGRSRPSAASRSRAEMQKNNQFAPLGAPDGLVKTAILGGNSARLYRVDVKSAQSGITTDKIASHQGGVRGHGRFALQHALRLRRARTRIDKRSLARAEDCSSALVAVHRAPFLSLVVPGLPVSLSVAGRRSAEDPERPCAPE